MPRASEIERLADNMQRLVRSAMTNGWDSPVSRREDGATHAEVLYERAMECEKALSHLDAKPEPRKTFFADRITDEFLDLDTGEQASVPSAIFDALASHGLERLKREWPKPAEDAPGMTDLMVPPESLDAYLDANPQTAEDAPGLCPECGELLRVECSSCSYTQPAEDPPKDPS